MTNYIFTIKTHQPIHKGERNDIKSYGPQPLFQRLTHSEQD